MAWYDSNWDYRIKITVNSSQVSANDTDYPVYVDLSDLPADFFTNVDSAGDDIRITRSDGTTECAYDLVSIDTGGSTGELHFLANSISSSSDTDFYIYYGNGAATGYAEGDTYGKHAVYPSEYKLVQHYQEASGDAYDSTSNNVDLVMQNGAGTRNTGKIQKGLSLTAASSHYAVDTNANVLTTGDVTISTWFYLSSLSANSVIVWTGGDSENEADNVNYGVYVVSDGKLRFFHEYSTGTNQQETTTNSEISIETIYHLVATRNTTTNKVDFYLNGSHVEELGYANEATGGGSSSFWLGCEDTVPTWFLNGWVDETRILHEVKDSNYVTTTYNNQSSPSTFLTMGSQETGSILQDIIGMGFIPFAR